MDSIAEAGNVWSEDAESVKFAENSLISILDGFEPKLGGSVSNHQQKNGLTDFIYGFCSPWIAARLIVARPRLWLACLLPWGIAGGGTWFFMSQVNLWVTAFLSWVGSVSGITTPGWVATLLALLGTVLTWVLGALLLIWLAALAAIPFADWLAELAEKETTPPLETATALAGWFSRAHLRRLKLDLFRNVGGLLFTALGFSVSAIPVLGALGLILVALGWAFQFLSFPQTRRDWGLVASLFFLIQELPLCLGLGLSLLMGFSVPFLGAFLFPLAVVAGTLVFGRVSGRDAKG